MMVYILAFLAGMTAGGALALGVTFVHVLKRRRKAKHENAIAHFGRVMSQFSPEKIIQARKRFGQIANRTSIGEARKIANTALKELEK